MMSKYQVGDKFNATLVITYFDEEDDEIGFKVKELSTKVQAAEIADYFTQDEVSETFDPNYKERMKQLRIKELEKELIKLKGEDK
jgi:hypothetical protein